MLPFYAYDEGDYIQLKKYGPVYRVIWRGAQLVGEPGSRVRQAVYKLDDEHWDCYFSENIHTAWTNWEPEHPGRVNLPHE
jgi:hypothetical protein